MCQLHLIFSNHFLVKSDNILPVQMPKTDAVIMIRTLSWDNPILNVEDNQLGIQGCCFFLTPPSPLPPPPTILCALQIWGSKHLMQPTNLVSRVVASSWHPNDFWCIAGLRIKTFNTTVGKIDTDDIINYFRNKPHQFQRRVYCRFGFCCCLAWGFLSICLVEKLY